MAAEDTVLRTLLVLVVALVLALVLVMAIAMPFLGMWGGGHMWNGGAGSPAWAWLATWLVLLAIVAGLGYLPYRALRRTDDRASDPAVEELRLAYARGDLSDEEFEERRDRLKRDR